MPRHPPPPPLPCDGLGKKNIQQNEIPIKERERERQNEREKKREGERDCSFDIADEMALNHDARDYEYVCQQSFKQFFPPICFETLFLSLSLSLSLSSSHRFLYLLAGKY
jgi:hypothetical protein